MTFLRLQIPTKVCKNEVKLLFFLPFKLIARHKCQQKHLSKYEKIYGLSDFDSYVFVTNPLAYFSKLMLTLSLGLKVCW